MLLGATLISTAATGRPNGQEPTVRQAPPEASSEVVRGTGSYEPTPEELEDLAYAEAEGLEAADAHRYQGPFGNHIDLQFHRTINNTAAPARFRATSTNSFRTLERRRDPVKGYNVCKYGMTSGYTCAIIYRAENLCYRYRDNPRTFCGLAAVDRHYSAGGDSGAGVFSRAPPTEFTLAWPGKAAQPSRRARSLRTVSTLSCERSENRRGTKMRFQNGFVAGFSAVMALTGCSNTTADPSPSPPSNVATPPLLVSDDAEAYAEALVSGTISVNGRNGHQHSGIRSSQDRRQGNIHRRSRTRCSR